MVRNLRWRWQRNRSSTVKSRFSRVAVDDDIFHLLHVRSVLDAFQQFSFARHFLIGGEQGEGFLYHRLKGKVVQLVMPSAVRAAIAAWMMA